MIISAEMDTLYNVHILVKPNINVENVSKTIKENKTYSDHLTLFVGFLLHMGSKCSHTCSLLLCIISLYDSFPD